MLTLRVSGQDGREIEVTTAQQWRVVRRSVDKMFDGWEELTTGRGVEATSPPVPPPVKKRYVPTRPTADYIGPTKADYMVQVLREAGEPLTAGELAERMIAAGWKTESDTREKRAHNVSVGLKRASDTFVQVGNRWTLRAEGGKVSEA